MYITAPSSSDDDAIVRPAWASGVVHQSEETPGLTPREALLDTDYTPGTRTTNPARNSDSNCCRN